jgi:hypothetical protein
MKIFIAYTIVVIGIPYLAGLLIGQILTMPIAFAVGLLRNAGLLGGSDAATVSGDIHGAFAWAQRGSIQMSVPDRIVHICMDVLNGCGAVLTAGFIFHLFGLPPSVFILLILAAWQIVFTIACKQAFRALFGDLAGIVIGWFLILWLFSAA